MSSPRRASARVSSSIRLKIWRGSAIMCARFRCGKQIRPDISWSTKLEINPAASVTDEARVLVEGYNEDDCRATERLRQWLRPPHQRLRSSRIRGSYCSRRSIPSGRSPFQIYVFSERFRLNPRTTHELVALGHFQTFWDGGEPHALTDCRVQLGQTPTDPQLPHFLFSSWQHVEWRGRIIKW
jgi:hypothetical protein